MGSSPIVPTTASTDTSPLPSRILKNGHHYPAHCANFTPLMNLTTHPQANKNPLPQTSDTSIHPNIMYPTGHTKYLLPQSPHKWGVRQKQSISSYIDTPHLINASEMRSKLHEGGSKSTVRGWSTVISQQWSMYVRIYLSSYMIHDNILYPAS